jgi:anti-sigma factor RsiW
MPDSRDHVDEALQDLLDGRLAAAEHQTVEQHLGACPRCRRLRDSMEQARQRLRADSEEAPSELRAGILAALDAEDRSRTAVPVIGWRRRHGWLAWAAAAMLTIAVLAVWIGRSTLLVDRTETDPVTIVATEHDRIAEGKLTVEQAADQPSELERFFAARNLPFRPRVLDIAMMGFNLAGGRVGKIDREPVAVMVYRSTNTAVPGLLICQMYRGRLAELPAADVVRRRGDFTFRLYQRGATTLVFWQEGELVCVLSGRGDPAAILDLATAKAMLAPRVSRLAA